MTFCYLVNFDVDDLDHAKVSGRLFLVRMVFLKLLIHPGQVLFMTICCLVNLDVDGLDHAHDLGQIDLDLYGILET